MKTVLGYDKFSEDYRLNENIIQKSWNKIVKFFADKFGKHGWFYYILFLQKAGLFPKKKIEVWIPDSYYGNVNKSEIPTEKEVEEEVVGDAKLATEKFSIGKFVVNEGVISLESEDMDNIDKDDLIDQIQVVYKMNLRRAEKGMERDLNNAIYIWGAPGIGKTSIIKDTAKKLDVMYLALVLNRFDPVDFRGVPKVENMLGTGKAEDEVTNTKIPGMFPRSDGPNNKGGIMFLDELNTAKPDVLNAALTLVLEGRIDTYQLPEKWIVVAASNRETDLLPGTYSKLTAPMSTRFGHFNFAPSLETWTDWAVKQDYINPDILAFIKFHKEYFYKMETGTKAKFGYPIPRTWDLASREDYHRRDYDWQNNLSLDRIRKIYTHFVGSEAANMFIEYLKLKEFYNEKDVEDVYKKGAKAKKLPGRMDQATAACGSIAFFKKGQRITPEEMKNVYDFALTLPQKETQSTLLSFLKMIHPYFLTDEPYKKIRWDYIKKWHIEEDETGLSVK